MVGVARLYAPFAGTLVIDEADADLADAVEAAGLRCVVTDTIMRDPAAAAALCEVALVVLGLAEVRKDATVSRGLEILPVEGIGEVRPGDDLARPAGRGGRPTCATATCWS